MSGEVLLAAQDSPPSQPRRQSAGAGRPRLLSRDRSACVAGSLPTALAALPREVLVERLTRSLQLSAAAGGLGTGATALVYLLVLRSPWLLLIVAAGAVHQVVHLALRRQCRRGELARAALGFCLSDWAIVLLALVIVPAVAPALVPTVLARVVSTMPYLGRRALGRLLAAALVVGIAVGALSRVDLVGVDDAVPPWIVTGFVVVFVPVSIAIVVLDLWQHSATLLETAHRVLTANAALSTSRETLAEQAEELRRSRSRLVVAADIERRRIERDLHDGAQQTLIGLCLGVSLLAQRQPEGSELRGDLQRIEDIAQNAVTELRDIAHGVYPPILASQGLAAALEAVVRNLRLPVRACVSPVGRRPPEQEAAVYFSVREGLQNVEKHAGPGAVAELVLREREDGSLQFVVSDSGRGFVVAGGTAGEAGGHGLQNIGDRLAAVGGHLIVDSAPGRGTRLTGAIPLQRDPLPSPQGVASGRSDGNAA